MRLTRNWWLFLLRGIVAFVFGLVAIFMPVAAFVSLVIVFGVFALVDGIFTLVSAFTSDARSENWWWLILEGLFGILIGVLTLVQPTVMSEAWLLLIAAWAIVTGVLEIITAVRLRKEITGEFWLILGGLFSIAFGILIAVYPMGAAFAVGLIIGIYALMFGIVLIMLALRMRKHKGGRSEAPG
ncbi:MAG TPA: HdeD family acid-resistance protein [Pyrinomonadaceae bacterium]